MNVAPVDLDELQRLITDAVRAAASFNDDQLLTPEEVAAQLVIAPRELRRLVHEGGFPEPLKLGERRIRWRRGTVRKWLDRAERNRLNVRAMTADPGVEG